MYFFGLQVDPGPINKGLTTGRLRYKISYSYGRNKHSVYCFIESKKSGFFRFKFKSLLVRQEAQKEFSLVSPIKLAPDLSYADWY